MNTQGIDNLKDTVQENIQLTEILLKRFNEFLPSLIFAIVVFLIGYLLAKIIRKLIRKIDTKSNIDKSVVGFLSQVVYYTVMIVFIIFAMSMIGVKFESWIAPLSALGVGIGLGLKDSLSDVASGIIILIIKPFKVGDFISYRQEISGTVAGISIMNTCLETVDLKKVYLPNSLLTNNYVINVNERASKKLTISFTLAYESDHEKAMDILKEMLEMHEDNINPNNTSVFIDSFSLYGVAIIGRCDVLTSKYWDMYYDVNRKLKTRYDKLNIHFAEISNFISKGN